MTPFEKEQAAYWLEIYKLEMQRLLNIYNNWHKVY